MKCANPYCKSEALYMRSGSLYAMDCVEGEAAVVTRRIIWLCETCAPLFAVETWRPPGQQLQHSKGITRAPSAEEPMPTIVLKTILN